MGKKRNHNVNCVKKFRECVDYFSYHRGGPGTVPLRNITFFLGAGFSFAWDKTYPLGTRLFEIDYETIRFNEEYYFF
jgi:hypothetical protein